MPDRVLVVDDDARMRRLPARLLPADGFDCDAAGTADEEPALEAGRGEPVPA
jgi:DNA-binding response OmpR family regulator